MTGEEAIRAIERGAWPICMDCPQMAAWVQNKRTPLPNCSRIGGGGRWANEGFMQPLHWCKEKANMLGYNSRRCAYLAQAEAEAQQ